MKPDIVDFEVTGREVGTAVGADGRVRIGVVTDRAEDAHAPVVAGLESVLGPTGGSALVVVHHRHHPGRGGLLRQLVSSQQLDAVVLLPLLDAGTGRCRAAEVLPAIATVPVVTLGLRLPGLPFVEGDEAAAAHRVFGHLVDERRTQRTLVVSASAGNIDATRVSALRAAAAAHRTTVLAPAELQSCVDRHDAHAALTRWLADRVSQPESAQIDSVVCGSDEIAAGVVMGLAERGLRVPEDVLVVGYGNTATSWRTDPPVSSVVEHLTDQGAAAGHYLLARLAGEAVPTEGRVALVAGGGLVIRQSSVEYTSTRVTELAGRSPEWRAERRRELHQLAMDRDESEVVRRIDALRAHWVPRVLAGTLTEAEREQLSGELAAIVGSYPEPVWWREWLETLGLGLEQVADPAGDPTDLRMLMLTVAVAVERALGDGRVRRERESHASSQHLLDLNRALVGCSRLVDLDRILEVFLPRLGISRCSLVLLEQVGHLRPGSAEPTGDRAEWRKLGRLVLRHGPEEVAADPAWTDDELWARAPRFEPHRLLPDQLRSELAETALVVQPVFHGESWFGFLTYEQGAATGEVGEALRVAVGRVLEAKSRNDQLSEVVAVRTAELEVEVANRELAQEELRAANDQLREALLRDGLTGLFNRPALDDHVGRVWRRTTREGRTFSVLMVDVDHFKSYNDVHGHLAGDECLRKVAELLGDSADRPDDMVARYGGEEFSIVLGDTDLTGAAVVAERVVRSVREAGLCHEGTGAVVTVSVGVACSNGHLEVADLLGAADRALYCAKAAGRDVFRLAEPMAEPAVTTPTP